VIASFVLAAAPLVDLMLDARGPVLISTPSIADDRVVRALGVAVRRGAAAKVILAPPVAFGDATVPSIGSDPYWGARREFDALKRAHADVFVDPRFSPVGAVSIQRNRSSRESYATFYTNSRLGHSTIICTGPMSAEAMATERNVCLSTDAARIHKALSALHMEAFDDTASPEDRERLAETARVSLVTTDSYAPALAEMVSRAKRIKIAAATVRYGNTLVDAIAANAQKVALIVPASDSGSDKVLAWLAKAGVQVTRTTVHFRGSMAVSEDRVFIGSQSIDSADPQSEKNVGVILPLNGERLDMLGEVR